MAELWGNGDSEAEGRAAAERAAERSVRNERRWIAPFIISVLLLAVLGGMLSQVKVITKPITVWYTPTTETTGAPPAGGCGG